MKKTEDIPTNLVPHHSDKVAETFPNTFAKTPKTKNFFFFCLAVSHDPNVEMEKIPLSSSSDPDFNHSNAKIDKNSTLNKIYEQKNDKIDKSTTIQQKFESSLFQTSTLFMGENAMKSVFEDEIWTAAISGTHCN